ncbi:MAG: bifunctional precorrin-2 dehydrogenase/sirohydrochlorin ferrochelatase [Ruminococcus sp.]|nr:bifunctional precorrin-2 dehydrogenase/sirohydrochlorin ferrochelatase [Ruminococcus sp.]
MGYFPFFIDIKDKSCLIVGGGRVALRKAQKLLPYEPRITVVASEICDEISILGVSMVKRAFRADDLDGRFMCIAATEDSSVNHRIFKLCTDRGILVNSVDDIENCGFVFPSLVKRGDISIGISTSGSAPAFAKHLRSKTESLLDEHTLEIAELIKSVRPRLKAELDSEPQRARAADELIKLCISSGSLPNEDSISVLLERIRHEG